TATAAPWWTSSASGLASDSLLFYEESAVRCASRSRGCPCYLFSVFATARTLRNCFGVIDRVFALTREPSSAGRDELLADLERGAEDVLRCGRRLRRWLYELNGGGAEGPDDAESPGPGPDDGGPGPAGELDDQGADVPASGWTGGKGRAGPWTTCRGAAPAS